MRRMDAGDEARTLGQRLASARKGKGLSVINLAELAGVSKAYVHQIENGECPRPSAQVLFNLATALGTSIAHLLGRAASGPEPEAVPIPDSLRQFAAKRSDVTLADTEMLARIRFRGHQPRSVGDWEFLWQAIKQAMKR
jgi:transcriptional regulator with XRE-family HTH domain